MMNKRSSPIDELQKELFEKELFSISKGLSYPRTPNIASSVMARLETSTHSRFPSRRMAWALTILFVFLSSLMLIPPARAAILEFIQIGVVRIFRAEPTPLSPPNQQVPVTRVPMTATPGATAQPLIPILEKIAGEKTLAEAQRIVDYPILLPAYPPDLGLPDRVFVQDADGAMTVLVWLDRQHPDEVRMSLHFLPADSWAIKKMEPTQLQETSVHGQRAIWAVGPYPLQFSNGDINFTRLVEGYVLIWTGGGVTYRLEISSSMEEAVKIAESLEPIP